MHIGVSSDDGLRLNRYLTHFTQCCTLSFFYSKTAHVLSTNNHWSARSFGPCVYYS